ncbi:hypothetical protein [Halalkalibacter akibai]|uniref:Uncharacterized protein n=1 Tax=Halalkalibacter akibai (strain ATCC 43226 / DSM 21942 / CIP 109018 / JCM 9157 / 1139) TaxID=1236973 RepID=W4QXH6_HALA3|nr:hypothetical protein [Halalkalibacter akibai]GAE36835.1 hypothetical protein JCM9157_4056 [Halalkalibacter akibai JCM 9157]
MTALIGYCFEDGAFLAADTQRILNKPGSSNYWAHFEVSKISKLYENIGFATCGVPVDEAKLSLQMKIKPESTKNEVTTLACKIYGDLLKPVSDIETNLVIFGTDNENGCGFIRRLEWDSAKKEFEIEDYKMGSFFADGFIPLNYEMYAESNLKKAFAPRINGLQLDYWAELMLADIVNWASSNDIVEEYGVNPVDFPIDCLVFRKHKTPFYKRVLKPSPMLSEYIQSKFIEDNFTLKKKPSSQ